MALKLERRPGNDWAAMVLRPFLIAGMMTCLAWGWVTTTEYIIPTWRGGYLVVLTAVLTLETLFAERIARRALEFDSRFKIRLVEIVLALVLLKPLSYFAQKISWAEVPTELSRWFNDPIGVFLNAEFLLGGVVLVSLWWVAQDISGALADIEDPFALFSERETGLSWLEFRFVTGGILLLGALAVVQIDYMGGMQVRPVTPGPFVFLPLAYFVLGLLLFGQARAALTFSRWVREHVPFPERVERRWVVWGVGLVGGVALLALFLPAGNTALGVYIFQWLGFVVLFFAQIIVFVAVTLIWLVMWPFRWLFDNNAVSEASPPQFTAPEMPDVTPADAAGGIPWMLQLRLAVFWILLLMGIYWAVRYYWRDRKNLGFGMLFKQLWAWLRRTRVRLALIVPLLLPRRRKGEAVEEPLDALHLEPVDGSRARVRQLYLALLEGADRAGHARAPGQTPYEYAAGLQPAVEGEEESLQALTEAFVQARYARQEFPEEEVGVLRRILDRLRAAFRRR